MGKYQYLAFSVNILKLMNLWCDEKSEKMKWKQWTSYAFFIAMSPITLPVLIETVLCFCEDDIDFTIKVQNIPIAGLLFGTFHMAFYFLQNSEKVKEVVDHVDTLKIYSEADVKTVDKRATFYAKILVFYTVIGLLFYSSAPLILRDRCEKNKFASMVKYGIPCGVLARFRLPFRYDKSPLVEIFTVHAFFVAAVSSINIVNITMLICGLLLHAVNHLKQLRKLLLGIADHSKNEIVDAARFAIKYHIAIIEFANKINEAFGSQLVAYLIVTSGILSSLLFEIIMLPDFVETVRFIVWLVGLLFVFYLICHFGQLLIDESVGVAIDAYCSQWYYCPVGVQKDIKLIILRAQKPLILKALSIGNYSARTFLGVLSSSYSYFTLLLNLK